MKSVVKKKENNNRIMEKHKLTSIIYNIVIVACLLIGAAIVIMQFVHFGNVEYTDNARVRQHITPQNTRVQGFIREIRFQEFQNVKKGDTLVIIEDAEFRLRLAQAEADLARAEQGSKATGSSIQKYFLRFLNDEFLIYYYLNYFE